MAIDVNKLLKELRKNNESCSFEDSRYGEISHYISTDDYGLNLIMTGNPLSGGYPAGRVITLHGDSATGKSLYMSYGIKNALNVHNYDKVFYFDSEGGLLKKNLTAMKVDCTKVEQILVESVEDLAIKCFNTMDVIKQIKADCPQMKFLVIVDSLGALVAGKYHRDIVDKNKVVSDQGGRSKICNNFIKSITIPCLKTDTACILSNHVYADPSAMFQSTIKNTSGGKGTEYISSVAVQLTRRLEKNEAIADENQSKFKASIINALIVKNRIVKPFYESQMFLDFSSGPLKYYSLVSHALRLGFLTKPKQGFYNFPQLGEKNYRLKEVLTNSELWEPIMADFTKASVEDMAYSTTEYDEAQILETNEEIVKEVEISAEKE